MSDVLEILGKVSEIKKEIDWIASFLRELSEKPCNCYDPSKSFMAKVNSSGMVTIPKPAREFHNIKEGDLVILQVVEVYRKGD